MEWILNFDSLLKRLDRILPSRKRVTMYYSLAPSGSLHLGNLRVLVFMDYVLSLLKSKGYDAESVLEIGDREVLNKTRDNRLEKFIGRRLVEVP